MKETLYNVFDIISWVAAVLFPIAGLFFVITYLIDRDTDTAIKMLVVTVLSALFWYLIL